MTRAIWTSDHVDYLAKLDYHNLTNLELSTLMSKHFRMRVTPSQISTLLTKMRKPGHEFYRDVPYRTRRRS